MTERLDSWKEICQYLKRDRSTLERWGRERGLPIHRIPGGAKPRVYALKSELDGWLGSGNPEGVPSPASAKSPTVAVLPFAILAGDKGSEYFGDGLADEIINALTRIPGLRVIARTSSFAFRGQEKDVRGVGARLGAGALLEGSVRRSGKRIRVSTQLVSATDGCHLWSDTYDRELTDVFGIQEEIARAIAAALRVQLGSRQLVRRPTIDLEAYGLWLKGRTIALAYTPEVMAQARECYQEALRRDPAFPQPHLSLAEMTWNYAQFGLIHARTGLEEVRKAVDRALALDDKLGEAHALDGALRGLLDFDWAAAGRAFERALVESPSSPTVLEHYGWDYLHTTGRLREAGTALCRAIELDPFSPMLHVALGLIRFGERNYAAAAAAIQRALDIRPGLWWAGFFLGSAVLFGGEVERGIRLCRAAFETADIGPMSSGAMAAVYGLAGDRAEARRILAGLLRANEAAAVPPLAMAWACLGAQDERVFEWLARTIEARQPGVLHIGANPIYDGVRNDPRFAALLRTMRLDSFFVRGG